MIHWDANTEAPQLPRGATDRGRAGAMKFGIIFVALEAPLAGTAGNSEDRNARRTRFVAHQR
jgi:hypothetical protein